MKTKRFSGLYIALSSVVVCCLLLSVCLSPIPSVWVVVVVVVVLGTFKHSRQMLMDN